MEKAAHLFYQQAYRPGFKSKWDEVIEKEARLSIQDRLVKHMKETGYTRAKCKAWPELPSGTLTRQEITEDLEEIYYDNKRTLTTFRIGICKKIPIRILLAGRIPRRRLNRSVPRHHLGTLQRIFSDRFNSTR